MSSQASDSYNRSLSYSGYEGQGRYGYPDRRRSGGISLSKMLVAGVAVATIGGLAWSYLGPDLVRYLKIRNM